MNFRHYALASALCCCMGYPGQFLAAAADNTYPPVTLAEKDAIMQNIAHCWSPPMGADARLVTIRVELNEDTSINYVGLSEEDQNRYKADIPYSTAVNAAIKAINKCAHAAFSSLPKEKFKTWRQLELAFDSRPNGTSAIIDLLNNPAIKRLPETELLSVAPDHSPPVP